MLVYGFTTFPFVRRFFMVFHGFFKELDFKELDFKKLDFKELDFKKLYFKKLGT